MSKLTPQKIALLKSGNPIPCIECGVVPATRLDGLCWICTELKIGKGWAKK